MAAALGVLVSTYLFGKTLIDGPDVLKNILYGETEIESNIRKLSPLEITNDIVSGKIAILDEANFSEKTIEDVVPPGSIDLVREYKDLSTEIVVKLFLSSDISMYNFLDLVYNTFNNSLDEYKKIYNLEKWDIFFVYKGGNVLRIISNDFLKELPRSASYKVNKYYENFFKRSDADFSIYINPSLENYDKIYKELTTLSYMLQVKIRQVFLENPTKYFEFYKYTKEHQSIMLEPFFKKLQESNSINDINNSKFYKLVPEAICYNEGVYPPEYDIAYGGNSDKGIAPIEVDGVEKKVTYIINPKPNNMFIQSNESLDFQASGNRTKFNLVRTKINFNYVFSGKNKNIGGELIDVSIPHRLDHNLPHFFQHLDYVHQYQLEFGSKVLNFYSYSLPYLISDLEYILYKFVDLPWKTPKYDKRLNRLFYLYFIDMFVVLNGNSPRKQIIKELLELFSTKIDSNSFGESILAISKKANSIKLDSKLEINKLINQVLVILERLALEKDELFDHINQYNKMMSVLVENCNFLLTAFDGIHDYCSMEGNINMKVLYQNDFSSLIGGGKK
jgi:hypothetical protein